MQALTFAYWANIVILVPIAVPTIFRIFLTDESRMEESRGWRVLVGSLWTAILVLSVLGLFAPERYAPVHSCPRAWGTRRWGQPGPARAYGGSGQGIRDRRNG